MLIGDYFDEVSRSIHDHQTAGFIQSSDLFTDARSDDLGYLRATLTFHDGSELHLREYIRISSDAIQRLAFAYHYQDQLGRLRFRYDNARHRPPLPSGAHKHVEEDVVPCEAVSPVQVIQEIVARHLAPKVG